METFLSVQMNQIDSWSRVRHEHHFTAEDPILSANIVFSSFLCIFIFPHIFSGMERDTKNEYDEKKHI